MGYILAIDQGTTSTRAILFDQHMRVAAVQQQEFKQIFPKSGWVEHDCEEIWQTIHTTMHAVLAQRGVKPQEIASIGITNQRETTVVWDKNTGRAIHNAIVWQDRRTADICAALRQKGHSAMVADKTGLLLDPYFSATKLAWILDKTSGARKKAQNGELLFGTIDSYLIWRLTGGKQHLTDATNAARTMLYNIKQGAWDADICALLDIPMQMLPQVKNCADDFGHIDAAVLGASVPITGVAGDQQSATIGQACFAPGMLKATYGTGCFALMNTGETLVPSSHKLLSTIAYQFNGKPTYALEGSIFIAGAVVQWLRDGLKIISDAAQTAQMASQADEQQSLYLVPAFTGLGAPYWDAECRGAIYGLTRNSGPNELARAALQSVGYQTRDLLSAMQQDMPQQKEAILRVDGGMSASDWSMQFLADILGAPVDRPAVLETTALGAAWLAGMHVGLYPAAAEFSKKWQLERSFTPQMTPTKREALYTGWQDAVRRTLSQ